MTSAKLSERRCRNMQTKFDVGHGICWDDGDYLGYGVVMLSDNHGIEVVSVFAMTD